MLRRLARLTVDAVGVAVERARAERVHKPRRSRLERFGAILQTGVPRALVFVDRAMARRMGAAGAASPALWREPEPALTDGVLSAPLEAHLQLTNRCGAGCKGCYTGASPQGMPGEWGFAAWCHAIDALADMGVFHVALGGGESAVLPWLGALALHARARGIIPNLTTSGLDGLDALLPIAQHFGQINVSIDGLGPTYAAVRGFDGFARADAAVQALRAVKREVGINVVVTRNNFHELDALFEYAAARRLSEIELLRFKPSGRGARAYAELRCTDAQHEAFLPAILAAARRHVVRVKVDCSYTPMLVHHRPDPALLAQLAISGCAGGDYLVGAKAGGQLTACSFAPPPSGTARPRVDGIADYWTTDAAFGAFRDWRAAREPCASCDYLSVCRGGCRVVSAHVASDLTAPDPECPRVRAHAAPAPRPRTHLPVI